MLVGNAVNVRVSSWIGEKLASADAYDGDNGKRLEIGDRWPAAAWSDRQQRYAVDLSTWPVDKPNVPLAEFLQSPGKPLSLRASAGFLARISNSSLRFRPGFREAIVAHTDAMRRTETSRISHAA